MKKWIALVCMITCIFGLTACGKEEESWSAYEATKISDAENNALYVVQLLESYATTEEADLSQYTAEEVSYIIETNYGIETDGYVFRSAIESFASGLDSIGGIVTYGTAAAKIDGDQIIVHVPIQGAEKDAEAEILFSNDMFYQLEGAALNPVSTLGDMAVNAALNTVIGMGTVFIVLILISLLISCFRLIPKLQEKFSKKEAQELQQTGIDNGAAQIVSREEAQDLSGDLELAAVIAAAVAAYEGSASADGFVVRSIHKVHGARR